MRIVLEVMVTTGGLTANDFMARALAGLRSVNDEGEELLTAMEAAVEPAPVTYSALTAARTRIPRAALLASLEAHGGRIAAVAREFGVSRSTVRDRIADYGITRA